jgi:hypothetical protein
MLVFPTFESPKITNFKTVLSFDFSLSLEFSIFIIIQFYVMDERTIELKTFRVNQTSDMNTTRIPLIKKEDSKKISSIQKKIEKEFSYLHSITNIHKIMTFIYISLILDILFYVYNGFELINALSDITKINLTPIFLLQYSLTVYNAVLYLKITINYQKFVKKEKEKLKYVDPLKEENIVRIDNQFDLRGEIGINKPTKDIKSVITFRIVTWVVKYLGYMGIIFLQTNFEKFEYINIPIFFIDYYLIINLSFYFKVLLRIDGYKTIYKLRNLNN